MRPCFFPLTIVVVLLTYIEEDAVETRKLAYGVVIANLAIYVPRPGGPPAPRPRRRPAIRRRCRSSSPKTAAWPSPAPTALFVDVVSTVVIFEQVSAWVRGSLFLRLWLCLMAIMALDSLLFTTGAFLGRPTFTSVLLVGLRRQGRGRHLLCRCSSRSTPPIVEAPGTAAASTCRTGDDVFEWLTYRQRYEQARTLMTRDALTGLFNRGYFDETGAASPGPRQPRRTRDEPGDDRRRSPEGRQRPPRPPGRRCAAHLRGPAGGTDGPVGRRRLPLRRRRVHRRAHHGRRAGRPASSPSGSSTRSTAKSMDADAGAAVGAGHRHDRRGHLSR